MIKTKRERLVYENKYVCVFDDDVIFPDGHEGTYFRSRWKAPHGVVVAPRRGEEILLLWNHRYRYASPSLEIPQGFGATAGNPDEDARRELLEETGCVALGLERIGSYGGADYRDYVFEAQLARDAEPHSKHAESTEHITGFRWLHLDDIRPDRFAEHGIVDQPTMTALMIVKLRRESR